MSDTNLSRVDAFLANLPSKQQQQPQPQRGSLIFAIDATGSREEAWDSAAELQVQMFKEAALLGGIDVQLVYYRGTQGFDAECKASGWVGNPMRLATLMSRIRCRAGNTQICRVLDHALRETAKRKIDAMAFVGDCFEERRAHAVRLAEELGRLKVPVFMFQEGRDQDARLAFQAIAQVSGGAYHAFDQGSAKQLGELLRAVAAFAVGGVVALEKQGTAAARLLLGQVR